MTLGHSVLAVRKAIDNRLSVIVLAVVISLFKLAFPSPAVVIIQNVLLCSDTNTRLRVSFVMLTDRICLLIICGSKNFV